MSGRRTLAHPIHMARTAYPTIRFCLGRIHGRLSPQVRRLQACKVRNFAPRCVRSSSAIQWVVVCFLAFIPRFLSLRLARAHGDLPDTRFRSKNGKDYGDGAIVQVPYSHVTVCLLCGDRQRASRKNHWVQIDGRNVNPLSSKVAAASFNGSSQRKLFNYHSILNRIYINLVKRQAATFR